MSFYTGTQSEVLFAGPPSAYAAAGASTASAFNAFNPGSGNFQQPLFPGGFWQQGRSGQVASFEVFGTVSGQASATTLALVLQLNTAANTTGGSTLITFPTLTVTSFASAPFWLTGVILNRGSGFGTSSVATNLFTSAVYVITNSGTTTSGAVAPTQLSTTDFSVNQWLTLQGTFSTSNAGNNITVNTVILRGEN